MIIPEDEVREICEKTKEVLSKEENVVPVRAPVTVVRAREPNQFTHAFHFPSICPFQPLTFRSPTRVIYVNRLETSMGSSRTWWSCSRLAAGHRRPTTSS